MRLLDWIKDGCPTVSPWQEQNPALSSTPRPVVPEAYWDAVIAPQAARCAEEAEAALDAAELLAHRRWLPAPPRPDVIVGQSLRAAMSYRADRGWLDHPKPKVMSTAPFDGFPGRVLLVITDPPTLDPDVWRQLRDRADLTCVVRP